MPARLDWLRAARAIREVALQHNDEAAGRARLTSDALILATALRIGATVVTRNAADFALLRPHLAATVVDVRP